MSAFAIQFGAKRATIACDSLAYVPDRREVKPLGFISKVLVLPHLKAVLFSRGQYEVLVRAWCDLMAAPDVSTIEQAAERLPGMLRIASDAYCAEQGIDDYREVGLLEAFMFGWSPAKRRMRGWQYLNYSDYDSQEIGEAHYGNMTLPALPKAHAPATAGKTADDGLVESVLAVGRYFEAEPAVNCGMRIGGEVIATNITPNGVSVRTLCRLPDYEQTRHASAAFTARITRGDLDTTGAVAAGLVPMTEIVDSRTGERLAA
jgi:hypothetical protein